MRNVTLPPAARVTDPHACPAVGPGPHVGGPILPVESSPNIFINGLPAATVGTLATCDGPPDAIVHGSSTVFFNGKPAARMGDMTAHGGFIIGGSPNVIIGDVGSGAPGSAGFGAVVSGAAATGHSPALASPHPAAAHHAPAAAHPQAGPAPFPCKSAWAQTVAHTNSIANMQDPVARNRKISADYAQMYQKDPDLQWAGLGAIVSRQAGCGMQSAQSVMDRDEQVMKSEQQAAQYGGEPGGDVVTPTQYAAAAQAKSALADANQLIYRTVSPSMSFVQQYGAKQMQSCLKSGDIVTSDPLADKSVPNDKVDSTKVSPQLSQAVDSLALGDNRKASNQIANYEQRDVVQDRIYNDPANKAVFGTNQFMSNWLGPVGRALGAQPSTIPLSADCTSQGHVPFAGSILSANDRVDYYRTLIQGFGDKGPQWQQSTMQQIINQGK